MEKGVFVGGRREREEEERARERSWDAGERENTEREELREEEVAKEVEEEEEEEAITSFVEGACAPALRTFGSSTSTTAAPEHRGDDDVKARAAMRPRPSSRE